MAMSFPSQEAYKRAAALQALTHIREGEIIGVGTGSTANYFIEGLAAHKDRIQGAVASSLVTAHRLDALGIPLFDLNTLDHKMAVYVDGADEIDSGFHMIKGGGGALTREKIVAAMAECFVCICDTSKAVQTLGRFPLPIEVIPMAQRQVARALEALGGQPILRTGFFTDNGNVILDVHGLCIADPVELETTLNQIVGIVCNGLFAHRKADVRIIAGPEGVSETRCRATLQ
jgi:ribose 5-phosphate isomerase A